MKTISQFAARLTDKNQIMHSIKALLLRADPQFPEEEARYAEASAKLKAIRRDAEEYLTAREERFAAAVAYMVWQGFQLNLYLHENPIPLALLLGDLERLYQEQKLPLLPAYRHTQKTVDAFRPSQSEEEYAAFSTVLDYYAHLETVGYKLAHYYGYRLSDSVLRHSVPGYVSDPSDAEVYRFTLGTYLQIDLGQLD